jgi:2-oxoisovalerate dehydrogenase E2 component (dihydrolipoyl transacylase)
VARVPFKLPDIGEGIAEAEIVAWHAAPGDVVEEDAPLADLMTDKATVEMTSPVTGKLVERVGEVGEQVAIGAVLAVFETDDTPEESTIAVAPAEAALVARTDIPSSPGPAEEPTAEASRAPALARVLASPAVRQRAKALGVDLAEVRPSQDGRVRHGDLDAYITYNRDLRPAGAPRADETIKLVGLRRRIAEHMAEAKRHIPHFTYVEEIEVTKLEALRADLNAARGEKPRLTILPLLITAICKSLPHYPMINARYDDEARIVTRHGAVHLGIATQTEAGLMVPVVRDAQDRNIWQLSAEIVRLAEAARRGGAKAEELSGSTLTVTSLGALGGIAATPIINWPEVAIIGPNRVVERPIVRGGAIVVAKMMNLSISCDHRIIDGRDAARFVQELKRLLETPALLFAPS